MLINLINDLLDLAKRENLTFKLNKNFFDLTKTIQDSFDTLKFISESRNIATTFNVKEDHEIYFNHIYGDSSRF